MYYLARLAMRGRWYAAVVAGGLAGVGYTMMFGGTQVSVLMFIPAALLLYASGAVVGLATLRNGPNEGMLVAGGASLLLVLSLLVTGGRWLSMVEALISVWLPAVVATAALARTASQGQALAALAGVAAVGWTLAFVFSGDLAHALEPWVRQVLDQLEQSMRDSGAGQELPMGPDASLELARVFVQLLVSWWCLCAVLTLMLARYWHARMDRPGGFGEEFRALRLPRSLALLLPLIVVVGALVSGGLKTYAGGLAQVGLVLFAVQGVAVVHALVKLRGLSSAWLVGVYVLPFVLPMAVLAIAFVGYLDQWFDYRRRATPPSE